MHSWLFTVWCTGCTPTSYALSVFENSTAELNCAHQYALSPEEFFPVKLLMNCTVDSRLGGLALTITYTNIGNISSAPAGEPNRDCCKLARMVLQQSQTHFSLAAGV